MFAIFHGLGVLRSSTASGTDCPRCSGSSCRSSTGKRTQPTSPNARTPLPLRRNVYEGLSDDDVNRLDEAVRQRVDLTRSFG